MLNNHGKPSAWELHLTAEDMALVRYLAELPRRSGRVSVNVSDLAASLQTTEERVIERLLNLQATGLISIASVPNDPALRSKLIQLIRTIDFRFLAGRMTETEYESLRRAAVELALGLESVNLNDLPPSPIILGGLIRRRSQLVTSLLNLTSSKEQDQKLVNEVVRGLQEIEATIDQIEGGGGGIWSEMLSGLRHLRERLEEDFLRTTIGDLDPKQLEATKAEVTERLDEIVQALGKYFQQDEAVTLPPFVEVEIELLRTRLNLGEISKEEYEYLYNELLRKFGVGSGGDLEGYLRVIEAGIAQLREQLDAIRGIRSRGQRVEKALLDAMEVRTNKAVDLLGQISDEIKLLKRLLDQINRSA